MHRQDDRIFAHFSVSNMTFHSVSFAISIELITIARSLLER